MAKDRKKKRTIHYCAFPGCNISSSRLDRLQRHQCTHTGERPFICKVDGCDKSYTCQPYLKRHMETVHSKKTSVFKCPSCDKCFNTNHNLKRHIKRSHVECHFECSECKKTFKKHQHLKAHEYIHTGVKPCVCPVEGCKKSFIFPSVLKRHKKMHEGYSCDECAMCNEIFPTWSALRKHKALKHQPGYKCEKCDRIFRRPCSLQVHKGSHEDMREAFHCTYKDCPRYYFFKKNLVQHINSYHLNKNLKCPHEGCNKEFVNKVKLEYHLKLHDPEKSPPVQKKKKKKNTDKVKKKRKTRKRKSIASILSNIDPPEEDEIQMLSNPDSCTFPLTSSRVTATSTVSSSITDETSSTSNHDISNEQNTESSQVLSNNKSYPLSRIGSECSAMSKECNKITSHEPSVVIT